MPRKLLWANVLLVAAVACGTPPTDTKEAEPSLIEGDSQANAAQQAPAVPASSDAKRKDRSGPVVRDQPARRHMQGQLSAAAKHAMPTPATPPRAPSYQDYGRENYQVFDDNRVLWASQSPVSTFSIDVDTASYANVRRILNHGQLPVPDAVRVEEMINYFTYDYPGSGDADTPFSLFTEIGPSPWDPQRRLLHVGINGWQPEHGDVLPPANLVFLVDVSGSMQAPNKIDLLKSAMKLLVQQLRPEDRLAIVVYAGAAGEVLPPTPGSEKATIMSALDRLQAGGSTNGGAGIRLAYQLARQNFIAEGVNRVLLATDGDFNVGTTDIGSLERLVETERRSGVALSVLGFGTGNYNDHLMQKIAQIGNGNAAYIDSLNEARKVLVDELGATLQTIAKDVKIQIEFNPAAVETYRLIGYETRHLNREDFNNDQVDAGEIGAGHTVTALYEITLADGQGAVADPLRYTRRPDNRTAAELGYLKLRYKAPQGTRSRLIERPLERAAVHSELDAMSDNFRFSAAVAWLGQILRGNDGLANTAIEDVIELAQDARGADGFGYRSEFISLARTAQALSVVAVNEPLARAN